MLHLIHILIFPISNIPLQPTYKQTYRLIDIYRFIDIRLTDRRLTDSRLTDSRLTDGGITESRLTERRLTDSRLTVTSVDL